MTATGRQQSNTHTHTQNRPSKVDYANLFFLQPVKGPNALLQVMETNLILILTVWWTGSRVKAESKSELFVV